MPDVTLQPMTADYYAPWMAALQAGYAQDHVDAGNWTAEEATARAAADTETLLPDGVNSPGQFLFTAHGPSGEQIGALWIGLDRPNNGGWIYEIEVAEEHRGSGYGRALLAAAEQAAKDVGAASLGLNVFGPNTVARKLYESSGYQVTTVQMVKPLP
jgi:GNAT superfamily N-acetyltransferase